MNMKIRNASRLTTVLVTTIFLSIFTPHSNSADSSIPQPRQILSGWIPYYSVKTVMPFVKKIPVAGRSESATAEICDASQYGVAENESLTASYLFTNSDLIKEVNPFWFALKSATSIRNEYVSGNPSWPMATTVCLMKRAGVAVVPTITDGTAKLVLSGLLANPRTRTQVVESIATLVNTNNFDGIDLDFEGFAFVDGNKTWAKTAPFWVAFVKELSTKLRSNGKVLSVTTPVLFDPTQKSKGYTVYAWAAIANDIDRLRIMTYDYSIARPGPIGPLEWTERSVKYAVSIMASSKVFVGLPGYGRDWITKIVGSCPTSAPVGTKTGAKAATFKMNYVSSKALIDKATPIFDTKTAEATYSYTQIYNGENTKGLATSCTVSRTVWFQNSQSYAIRAALVEKYKLGGVALWTLGMEDVSATQAIRSAAMSFAPEKITSKISVDKNEISYGQQFILSGVINGENKVGKSGVPVIIEHRKSDQQPWRKLTDVVTSADGTFSLPLTFASLTYLQARTEGTWEISASISNQSFVQVRPRLSHTAPAVIVTGKDNLIFGTVFPRKTGVTVQLQKWSQEKWQNVSVVLSTDSEGNFELSLVESKRGVFSYRILYFLEGETIENKSNEFSIVVR
jgi:spore germination protein YaaH/5-hydroxyisourate hydrolase-like protein (transthyretin family)